jgi:prevent-host-death family protein
MRHRGTTVPPMAAANEVTLEELRDHTAAILERVAAGEHLTITVDGRPVGELVPPVKGTPKALLLARYEWAKQHPVDDRFWLDIKAMRDESIDDLEERFKRWGWDR